MSSDDLLEFDYLKSQIPPASMQDAAVENEWFLSTTGRWAKPYFDAGVRYVDHRRLFA